MRKILRLARREYLASVKTKGFIIGLVLMPVIMGGSGIAMYLFRNQVDTTDKKIVVIDHSGVVANMLIQTAADRNKNHTFDKETGKKIRPAYIFESVPPDQNNPLEQRLELSNLIRDGELHAFLEIGPNVVTPETDRDSARISYHSKNAALDNIRGWINNPINTHLRTLRMQAAGVEQEQVQDILTWLQIDPLGLVSVDSETGEVKKARRSNEGEAIGVPIVMFMLMFMMVMMGAMPLLSSIMEEKNQRIAEVLLGCLKPVEFMAGKVLGGLAVSLTGSGFYVLCGIFLLNKLGLTAFIPYSILPWFFTFMFLNIIMVGSMLAALGSACNDAKDAQNLTFPAMLPIMIPMFLLMPILQEPSSSFATGLSLFPPFTPMLMLLRICTPMGVPAWQPWVGLSGVLLFTLLSVWAGGRIFRVGILMQGKPPKISHILRWAIRG